MTGLSRSMRILRSDVMQTEKIYTDLFVQNRQMVDDGSCQVLNSQRQQALEALEQYGLPVHQEEYLHTDVSQWFQPDWGLNIQRHKIQADSVRIQHGTLPEGVVVETLEKASAQNPALVEKYYNRLADMKRPGIAAINAMFCQDGVFIYVPKNTVVEQPVQLVSLLQSPVSMMVNRRILVVLEQGASLSLVMTDHSGAQNPMLATQVTEVFVGAGATLRLYEMEETGVQNLRAAETFVLQQADSNVQMGCFTLTNGKTRNSTFVTLAEPGANLQLDGAVVTDRNQHVDNFTSVDHKAGNCTSSELYKYVLDDESTGNFYGKVLVRPDSQHTASAQTNRNICVSKKARMWTQPQLEIYADDVKCSHGATVGQLDEQALFYMRQRGIPYVEARMLLMQAFLNEVTDRVQVELLRERLHLLVEKRLRGELNQCQNCGACK